jgi:protein-tyrosine phosphatase
VSADHLAQPSPRHVVLEGAANFRDLGGYATATGQHVRWGSVYRADNLSELTDADHEILRGLGIKTVIDLRTSFEFELGAFDVDKLPVALHHLPLVEGVPDPERFLASPGFLASSYVEMLEQAGPHFAFALTLLASPEQHPAVFHCAVGKDRTGVLAAVLLGLLGVPDETIVADYALSAEAMVMISRRFIERFPEHEALVDVYQETVLSAKPSNMKQLLEVVAQRWGSMVDYVVQLGVSDATIAKLRSSLLE